MGNICPKRTERKGIFFETLTWDVPSIETLVKLGQADVGHKLELPMQRRVMCFIILRYDCFTLQIQIFLLQTYLLVILSSFHGGVLAMVMWLLL